MFGRLFHKKREEVMRVLHGRVNRAHARSIACQNIRGATRQIFNESSGHCPANQSTKPISRSSSPRFAGTFALRESASL